jgi:tetratricopeptide (TPR) repeat protein
MRGPRAIILWLLAPVFVLAQADQATVQKIASALRDGRFDSTLQLLGPALKQFPNDPRLWTMQGVVLSEKQHQSSALIAYRRALKISPDDLPALEGAAQIEYEEGGKDAAPLLQHILKLSPDSPPSHAMLGVLAYRQGDCSEAVRHFDQSVSILDSQPAALQQYGSCLVMLHRFDQALVTFQKLVDLNPDDSHSRSRLAAVQLTAEHPKDAIATLQPLLQGHPETYVFELAAKAYEADKDTPQAESTLRQAMLQDPANVDLYVDFATLAFDHGSFAAGIEMMTSGLQAHSNSTALYLERGILYVQVADYEKAEADFEKASQIDPRQTLSGVAQGKVAEQHGDFEKALATVQGKLAKNPDDAFLLYTRADILVQKGVDPGTRQFQLALESARKALVLQPSLVLAHDILGDLYLRAGQFESSIKQSRQALEDNPKDQAATYHLIVALRKTGNSEELPGLLQRLAQLRQEEAEERAHENSSESQTAAPLQ